MVNLILAKRKLADKDEEKIKKKMAMIMMNNLALRPGHLYFPN
jgi:hypothetical protein